MVAGFLKMEAGTQKRAATGFVVWDCGCLYVGFGSGRRGAARGRETLQLAARVASSTVTGWPRGFGNQWDPGSTRATATEREVAEIGGDREDAPRPSGL
jgi:hypothetical protein